MQKFAVWLREQRSTKGWTQQELAEKLGVHWVTVSRWERQRTIPSQLAVRQIQETLGVFYKKDKKRR